VLDPCLLLSCCQVQYEEGEALAKELGIDYVETSAMNGVGIDTDKGPTAFTRLINRMDALAADGDDEDASCLEAALDICLCSSCCEMDEEEKILHRMPNGLYGLGYTGALLTLLLGAGLITTAVAFHVGADFAVQQWTLFTAGFLTLIVAVIAGVGVQKRSATLNKLHLAFMITTTLLTVLGSLYEILAAHQNTEVATVVLAMGCIQLPVIIIAFHRHRVERLSFLEAILEHPEHKASVAEYTNNVYNYEERYHGYER
jgi:hypothetical protein